MKLFWEFLKAAKPFGGGFPTFFHFIFLSPEEAVYFDKKMAFMV